MLTQKQTNLIIGGILGDCGVHKNGANSRIAFDHSISQLEYITWKHSMLSPHITKLVKYSVFDKRTQKTYNKVRFKTKTTSFFNSFQDIFYLGNRKIIPNNIKDYLNSDLALAVWYLDDGALRTDCKGLRLHTNNFSYKEVLILKNVLLENFQVESKPHKQANGFNLYVGANNKQAEKFCATLLDLS